MSNKLSGYVWDGCASSGMKLSSVAIMARLADWCNDDGVCWPSVETIARQTGAGISTVRKAIAQLEEEGWLTRKQRRKGNRNASNVYQLNVGKLFAAAKPHQPDSDTPESDQSKSGGSGGEKKASFHPPESDASKFDQSKSDPSKRDEKASFHPPESGGDPSVNSNTDPSDKQISRPGEKIPVDNFSDRHPDAVIFDDEKNQWAFAEDLDVAQWFFARIVELYERAAEYDGTVARPREPDWTTWANEIRLLCEIECCTHKQIREIVERIHRDPFWCRQILSTAKLREKWPDLVLKLATANLATRRGASEPSYDYSAKPEGFRVVNGNFNQENQID